MTDWTKLTRQLRLSLGFKQAAFAEYIGTTQPTVSRWERGMRVPEERFQRRIRAEFAQHDIVSDDTMVLAMIRYSPNMISVVDRSLRFVTYSFGLQRVIGAKTARLDNGRFPDVMTPTSRGIYAAYLSKMFQPSCEFVSISVNDRSAMIEGAYTRRNWSVIKLSGERFVVCQDHYIPAQEARLLDLQVVTLDDMALAR